MDEPKSESGSTGSWWATLPGLVTALAALLTAVGGLLVTLNQIGWLKKPPDTLTPIRTNSGMETQNSPPNPPNFANSGKEPLSLYNVEGIEFKIVAMRRSESGGGSFIDLVYNIISGPATLPQHDPFRFIRLVWNGTVVEPVSTHVRAIGQSPNGSQQVSARFPALPAGVQAFFRFGEQQFVDVPVDVKDR
jgi:hypothetical protein